MQSADTHGTCCTSPRLSLRIQKEAEQEIRKKLITEMKDAQWEIAEAAVKKWKETELKKLENPSEQKTMESAQPNDARRTEYVV